MTKIWIYRDLTHVWEEQSAQPIRILLGPRQSGKTSFLEHLAHPSRKFVNFDDLPTWIPPKAIRKLPHCEFVVVSLTGGPSSQGVEHISLEQIAGFLKNKVGFQNT